MHSLKEGGEVDSKPSVIKQHEPGITDHRGNAIQRVFWLVLGGEISLKTFFVLFLQDITEHFCNQNLQIDQSTMLLKMPYL